MAGAVGRRIGQAGQARECQNLSAGEETSVCAEYSC